LYSWTVIEDSVVDAITVKGTNKRVEIKEGGLRRENYTRTKRGRDGRQFRRWQGGSRETATGG
jgi:hypothetical protein